MKKLVIDDSQWSGILYGSSTKVRMDIGSIKYTKITDIERSLISRVIKKTKIPDSTKLVQAWTVDDAIDESLHSNPNGAVLKAVCGYNWNR